MKEEKGSEGRKDISQKEGRKEVRKDGRKEVRKNGRKEVRKEGSEGRK